MKKYSFLIVFMTSLLSQAQNNITCPPLWSGDNFDLEIMSGTTAFYEGYATATNGINQSYLGPVLEVQKGDSITLNVTNSLNELSTMHWHGLHIPAAMDGGPFQTIDPGSTWSPSFTIRDQAGTYWFHPHPHMSTLKQVTLGAAGLMIVRDETEAQLDLPRTYAVDDFPIILSSVHFNADKQIDWASMDINTALVNGSVEGVLNVPAQVVRLRLVNASNHMSYYFGFETGESFAVIGGDAGLLASPVTKTKLLVHAGERYEILVDLSALEGQTLQVMSFGSEIPTGYPGSSDMMGMSMASLDDENYNLFTLAVGAPTDNPVSAIPSTLTDVTPWSTSGVATRPFLLTGDGMMNVNFAINGDAYDMDVINETVELGDIEIWNITNQSMVGHPFHIHGQSFYITQWNGTAPPAELQGRKDVVLIPPQMGNVKVVLKFEDFADPDHPYMYHCHILDHEDMGMMGQYIVNAPSNVSNDNNSLWSIYPTITEHKLTIQSDRVLAQNAKIQIVNGLGQVVRTVNTTPTTTIELDIHELSAGTYIVKVILPESTFSARFIKP